MDGQVSRYFVVPHNLVNQDQTQLTSIVSLDPLYVNFDVDETTILKLRQLINQHLIERYQQGEVPVFFAFGTEESFPHEGRVNFVNPTVNSGTGSITIRAVMQNPKPADGARLISPGMFARVRLPIGKPHPALLVIDRALGSDQGLKYAYVMNPETKVIEQRRVTTGELQENGLRVIESGLKAEDLVVVGGIQQVRARMQIKPDEVTMPTLGTAAEETNRSKSSGGQSQQSGGKTQPTGDQAAPEKTTGGSDKGPASQDSRDTPPLVPTQK